MKSTKVKQSPYMSYATFSNLNAFIEREMERIHLDFVKGTGLLGIQKLERGDIAPKLVTMDEVSQKAQEVMWENYHLQLLQLNEMQTELKRAFKLASHPNVRKGGFFNEN